MSFARVEIDFALRTFEARGKPHLLLSPIASFPGNAEEFVRNIVCKPIARPREYAYRAHAGFLLKLAPRRVLRILALIEAALRHLPPSPGPFRLFRVICAPADKGVVVAVQQHHADARPVG
jgi:hypothetical protein